MASLANSSVLVVVVLAAAAAADAVTFTIINKCGYTVWPAALPSGDGNQLDPGQSWAVYMPAGTKGALVWGRTDCGFISGGNLAQCARATVAARCGARPSPSGSGGGADYFDMSLVDGFNAPMAIVPAGGRRWPRGGPRCAAEITLQCLGELRAKAGCSNPCRGNSTCGPTKDTEFFKKLFPETVTYARDDHGTTFTCPASTDYQIVFCP
uniref:Thaumatin-like protein n=1 Tax=Oryza punctata TaxID=4537 RepID=A0A0E0KH35_ORYPU